MPAEMILILAAGWVLLALLAIYGLIVGIKMYRGTIDLSHLLAETNGQASLSRFQFLLFTYVVAGGVLLALISSLKSGGALVFPDINGDILSLMGISGGSYVVSKGIQKQAEIANPDLAKAPVKAAPAPAPVPAPAPTV